MAHRGKHGPSLVQMVPEVRAVAIPSRGSFGSYLPELRGNPKRRGWRKTEVIENKQVDSRSGLGVWLVTGRDHRKAVVCDCFPETQAVSRTDARSPGSGATAGRK